MGKRIIIMVKLEFEGVFLNDLRFQGKFYDCYGKLKYQ